LYLANYSITCYFYHYSISMSNATQKVKGAVQEAVGKVIGNERMQAEGESKQIDAQQAKANKHGQTTGRTHGRVDQTVGGAKQHIGSATGNPNLEARGAAQRTEGTANKNDPHYHHGQQTTTTHPTGGYTADQYTHGYDTRNKQQTAPHGLTGEPHYGAAGVPTDRRAGYQDQPSGNLGQGRAGYTNQGAGTYGQGTAGQGTTGNNYTHDPAMASAHAQGQASTDKYAQEHGQYATGTHPQDQGDGQTGLGTQGHGQYVGNTDYPQRQDIADIQQARGQISNGGRAQEHGQYVAGTHPQGQRWAGDNVQGTGQNIETSYSPRGQAGTQAYGQPSDVPHPQERGDGTRIPADYRGTGGTTDANRRFGNDTTREYL
jgi:uncharacterized protein YjbJ (UPF0337 family)